MAAWRQRRFTQAVRDRIADGERFVSQVCAIEIAIKQSIGRLDLIGPLRTDFATGFQTMLDELGADLLPIETTHIGQFSRLPLVHRDPFDRLIVAQGLATGMTVITSDRAFSAYSGLSVLEI